LYARARAGISIDKRGTVGPGQQTQHGRTCPKRLRDLSRVRILSQSGPVSAPGRTSRCAQSNTPGEIQMASDAGLMKEPTAGARAAPVGPWATSRREAGLARSAKGVTPSMTPAILLTTGDSTPRHAQRLAGKRPCREPAPRPAALNPP
jgi:hypothetical protein